jgi:hypothetical protein
LCEALVRTGISKAEAKGEGGEDRNAKHLDLLYAA